MADNELTVVRADSNVRTLRSRELQSGTHEQMIGVLQGPETPPTLTGATLVYTVDDNPAVALDPPTAGADQCFIRVWHATQDSTKRLFYRRDGTAPTADGANAEGFLLHAEGKMVTLATFTNFQVISETGAAHTVYAEWSDT
jgi:hypothetical protein